MREETEHVVYIALICLTDIKIVFRLLLLLFNMQLELSRLTSYPVTFELCYHIS